MLLDLEEVRKGLVQITKEELIDFNMYTEEEIKRDSTIMEAVKEVPFDLMINNGELTEKFISKVESIFDIERDETPTKDAYVETYSILKDAGHPLIDELNEFLISNYEAEVIHSNFRLEEVRKDLNERFVDFSLKNPEWYQGNDIDLDLLKASVVFYLINDVDWIVNNQRGSLNRLKQFVKQMNG